MFVHILSLMQFLRLDILLFTCTDCIFSFYYRIQLFWSKTGNDTDIQGESKKTDTFDIQMNNKGVSFF